MFIRSLELKNFRSYPLLELKPDPGINLFYGDNAQGKTNILESVYVSCTSRSHKSAKDREMIRFGEEESHIRLQMEKRDVPHRIDIHLKRNSSKGIAHNGVPIRRLSELFGIANVVIFSPEDLHIIKNGPSERRHFMDMELCQLNRQYVSRLISYNRVVMQKNKLLKEMEFHKDGEAFLEVYNEQMVTYGTDLIRIREDFIHHLSELMQEVHHHITDGREDVQVLYAANVSAGHFAEEIERHRERELRQRVSLVGPHRDDLTFLADGEDLRYYGSQGQQRTAVLSLKLSEIKLAEEISGDTPVLLLDDVLSELDSGRQEMLLKSIHGIQTMITCTGLEDFTDHRFEADKIFHVKQGEVTESKA